MSRPVFSVTDVRGGRSAARMRRSLVPSPRTVHPVVSSPTAHWTASAATGRCTVRLAAVMSCAQPAGIRFQ